MAKKAKPEGKKYNYMDTYGDLVTLLLCFFVLLFAMSTVQEDKYNAFVEALNARFSADPAKVVFLPPEATFPESSVGDVETTGDIMSPDQTLPMDMVQLEQAIQRYLEENDLQDEVQVETGQSGATFIRMTNNILFTGDSSALSPEATQFLNYLGECFLALDDEIWQVQFNGHTASIPGSSTDDWVLSAERAGKVSSYFERTVGFSPYKIQFSGYGRNYPIADNNTAEGRAANRRVDVVVISNNTTTLLGQLEEAAAVYFPDDSTQFFEGTENELPGYALPDVAPNQTTSQSGEETSDAAAGETADGIASGVTGASGSTTVAAAAVPVGTGRYRPPG